MLFTSSTKPISQRFVLYESFIQLNYMTICTSHYPGYSQIVLLQVISSTCTCGNILFLNFNVFPYTYTWTSWILSVVSLRDLLSFPSPHRDRQALITCWEQCKWERFGGLWQRNFSTSRVYRSNQLGGRCEKDGEVPGRREAVKKPPAPEANFSGKWTQCAVVPFWGSLPRVASQSPCFFGFVLTLI